MISLKRLIMNPKSPDRALQQAYSEAEGALARIAHVNRLSRDIMDIKHYELDLNTSNVLRISSKKGIVDVLSTDPSITDFFVYLQNPEITPDHDKFYTQFSIYSSNQNVTPIIVGRGYSGDQLLLQIKNIDPADNWGLLYFYFEIVKID